MRTDAHSSGWRRSPNDSDDFAPPCKIVFHFSPVLTLVRPIHPDNRINRRNGRKLQKVSNRSPPTEGFSHRSPDLPRNRILRRFTAARGGRREEDLSDLLTTWRYITGYKGWNERRHRPWHRHPSHDRASSEDVVVFHSTLPQRQPQRNTNRSNAWQANRNMEGQDQARERRM